MIGACHGSRLSVSKHTVVDWGPGTQTHIPMLGIGVWGTEAKSYGLTEFACSTQPVVSTGATRAQVVVEHLTAVTTTRVACMCIMRTAYRRFALRVGDYGPLHSKFAVAPGPLIRPDQLAIQYAAPPRPLPKGSGTKDHCIASSQ
eukprot:4259484-Pyramimonas_sp.AAC.1